MILRSLGLNLRAGLRLAFFLPLRPFDYRASAPDYAALVAFNVLVWIAGGLLPVGLDGEFDAGALPLYLATVPLVLATAMWIAAAYRAADKLLLLAVALTASDTLFDVLALALPYTAAITGLETPLYFAWLAWMWLASVRAVAVCAGPQRPQLYQGALAVSAMLAIAFFAFPKIEAWQPAYEDDDVPPLADERLFHLQGELIERALAAIRPGQPGVREQYFVGFAPDGTSDVFLREMRFVKRLFEERFGAAGRAVALVSSNDALEEFPIASVTNLARTIERVGQVMNRDEDVLFLYVAAHGDREQRLSASQPPLELASLTPTALARMLQDSGIKWRVIVVSACYSGGFIEPLRDDNTLIITAAASDRSSFGCEAGRDFTYFGQAFFRDALMRTRSFTEAFRMAADIVARQEAAERLVPSAPQISVGRSIAGLLQNR